MNRLGAVLQVSRVRLVMWRGRVPQQTFCERRLSRTEWVAERSRHTGLSYSDDRPGVIFDEGRGAWEMYRYFLGGRRPAFEHPEKLQKDGMVKIGFDRAGTSTARKEDVDKFKTKDRDVIKNTFWFYGYQTAAKQTVKMEAQNWHGTLEFVCIEGGPITQVEAAERSNITEDAGRDAAKSGIHCELILSHMSFYRFKQKWTQVTQNALGGDPDPKRWFVRHEYGDGPKWD